MTTPSVAGTCLHRIAIATLASFVLCFTGFRCGSTRTGGDGERPQTHDSRSTQRGPTGDDRADDTQDTQTRAASSQTPTLTQPAATAPPTIPTLEIADLISVTGRNRHVNERVRVEGFTTRCMMMDCEGGRCEQEECCHECTTHLGVSRFSNAANGCLVGMRTTTDGDTFDISAIALRFPGGSGCAGTECEQTCDPIPVRQYYGFEGTWRRYEDPQDEGVFDYFLEVDHAEFITDNIRSNSAVAATESEHRDYGGAWSVHRTWEMVRPVLIGHVLLVRAEWRGGCVDQQFGAQYRIRGDRAEVWLRRSEHRDDCDSSTWQRVEVLLPDQVLEAAEIVLRGPGFAYQMR